MKTTWQLQEAKNKLSLVVERAQSSGVQTITKHGKPVVVVVSVDDYAELAPEGRKTLLDWLRSCPSPGLADVIPERDDEPVRSLKLG